VGEYGRTLAYLVFIGCCLIWGSTFLAIRIGNEAVPPVWAATIRLALAAPLLAGLVLATLPLTATLGQGTGNRQQATGTAGKQ